jgi:hypothetical protein
MRGRWGRVGNTRPMVLILKNLLWQPEARCTSSTRSQDGVYVKIDGILESDFVLDVCF